MQNFTPSQLKTFNNLYAQYYRLFQWRCHRAVKDDVVASGIVQEAFLNVWLLRDSLSLEDVYNFLKKQVKTAITTYYNAAVNRFHKNLFRLDELENPDFILGDTINNEEEEEAPSQECSEELEKYQQQSQQLQQLLPSLSQQQQLLISLCIKYNFSYDRMSYYLGGISDYTVSKQIEELLKNLKRILADTQKLQQVGQKTKLTFSGNLDELQQNIIKMRFDLQYGFEEIAANLNLSEAQVKQAYARACRICS